MKIKILLFSISIIAIALLYAVIKIPASKEMTIIGFVRDSNSLTVELLKLVGNPPTFEGVRQAQTILNEKKNSLSVMVKKIKSSNDFTENSNADVELKNCRARNRNLIAEIYNSFAKKSSVDNNALNELKKQKMDATSHKLRRNLEDQIEKQTQVLRNNIKLLEEIDRLIANFEAIFDKNLEEQL